MPVCITKPLVLQWKYDVCMIFFNESRSKYFLRNYQYYLPFEGRGKMTLSKDLLKRIEQVVGPANFFPAETDRICYATDSSLLSQMNNWMPDLVVRVLTSGQVSQVLALANEFHVPVVPRGAGTGQCCGAVARHGGIMMDLTGMNRIVSMDLDNMQVTVQPGIVHAELNKELAVHGFFFPPDPGSTKMCTLGGMVSNNSSGQRSAKYGTTKQYNPG